MAAENLIASTPKVTARSSENIRGKEPAYELDFDDDDTESVDQDVSEIELPEEGTISRGAHVQENQIRTAHVQQHLTRDDHVELSDEEEEEIPEEEAFSDDNAFDDDELFGKSND